MDAEPHFTGFVDGWHDGELVGWLAGPRGMRTLPRLRIMFDDGNAFEWSPAHHRADVCEALGRAGMFGFHIPGDLLSRRGQGFHLADSQGRPLPNGRFESPALQGFGSVDRPVRTSSCAIYLHIQKVGGTSVNNYIHTHVPKSRFAALYPDFGLSLSEFVSLPTIQKRFLDVVIGHTYFGVGKYIGAPVRYSASMRDPLARVRSQIYHVLRHNGPTVRIDGVVQPLHRVVNEGLTEEFDNLQLRMIAGLAVAEVELGMMDSDHAELAIHNIGESFAHVADIADLTDNGSSLTSALGLSDGLIPSLNETHHDDYAGFADELALIDWHAVARRHEPEQQLYRWLTARRITNQIRSGQIPGRHVA